MKLSISFSSAANQTPIHVQKYFDVNHRKMATSRQPTTTRPKAVLPSRPYTIPLVNYLEITFYFNGSIIIDY
jgi:hypothetical protein